MDIYALMDLGYNIVRYPSTQNRYFVADRKFDFIELKLMPDVSQVADFISGDKMEKPVNKIASTGIIK